MNQGNSEQVVSEQPKQSEQQFSEPGSNHSESPLWHNTVYNPSNVTSNRGQSNPWNNVTNTQYWSQKPSKQHFGKGNYRQNLKQTSYKPIDYKIMDV